MSLEAEADIPMYAVYSGPAQLTVIYPMDTEGSFTRNKAAGALS
jgi:hypothetical protein